MENGFSSPRSDAFPAGLRVLVVDDDPTWLKILEKMLKKCSYEVTTCGLAREALNLLRERKDGYDIVISDVNMPDMDGFKLLEHVGLEMDLPVIMMSVDGETSRVMKGVQHGACDYLLKPIRMKELRNIWQHVLRKKIHEVREIESHDCFEGMFGLTGSEQSSEDGQFIRGEDMSTLLKKRKDFDKNDEKDIGDASSMKKSRVVWSVDLHQKFVKAVDQIGFQRVGPKKILDLMNVPWLTRENVASHLQFLYARRFPWRNKLVNDTKLQKLLSLFKSSTKEDHKYRLYLDRLQKQNDGKSCGMGIKPFDVSSNAPTPPSCLQNTLHLNQNEAQNLKHALPGNSFPLQKVDMKGLECNLQRIVSEHVPELKRAVSSSPTDSTKSWQMKFSHSELNFAASQQNQIEALETQLKAENNTLMPLKSDFIDLPSTNPQSNFQVDQLQSISSITSSVTTAGLNKAQYLLDSFPAQHVIDEVNQLFKPPSSTTSIGMKKQELIESCLSETGRGLHSDLFDNDMQLCWLQEDCIVKNLGQNIDFTDCKDSGLITDYIGHDYWYDPTEYIVMDDGMFTS